MKKSNFTFIDLFCGIGGFHQAMASKGGICVFASEIDDECIKIYNGNYHMDCGINICDVSENDIPKHDVLCGGFPCQAFSKAGKQEGINDTRGTLFFEIERILKAHHTKYIILENVRNLVSHNQGDTWKTIQKSLKKIGYRLTEKPLVLSPHQFGIPQLRERVFILGKYEPSLVDVPLKVELGTLKKKSDNSIYTILDENAPTNGYSITEYENYVLDAWDEFYKGINEKIIGFPIWVDYFKTNKGVSKMPKWKKEFVQKNQNLYLSNKEFIDMWLKKYKNLKDFIPTHKKFEWQAGDSIESLWEGVIQFRPSGIRVKKPDVFPALVAIVQIPIIGKYKRRLTVKECSRLQSFNDDFISSTNKQQAYKQFGNSVNVEILKRLYSELIKN